MSCSDVVSEGLFSFFLTESNLWVLGVPKKHASRHLTSRGRQSWLQRDERLRLGAAALQRDEARQSIKSRLPIDSVCHVAARQIADAALENSNRA